MKISLRRVNQSVLLFFLLAFPHTLFSSVFHHLKKAENKGFHHSMRNIDFIYMINLDERPEKYQMSVNQLAPFGIHPYRFSAVNGWKLTVEEINDIGIKYNQKKMKKHFPAAMYDSNFNLHPARNIAMIDPSKGYFCSTTARGTIGISISHISVLQDAYDSKYKTVWIMEDDIEVVRDPTLISDMIKKLDKTVGSKNWDIFFTDRDIKNAQGRYVRCYGYAKRPNWTPSNPKRFRMRKEVRGGFIKVGARFGAHSFIIRRSGIKKLLDFFHKYGIFLPYDMEYYLPKNIQLYTVSQDIVCQLPKALSDNGAPRYSRIENQ